MFEYRQRSARQHSEAYAMTNAHSSFTTSKPQYSSSLVLFGSTRIRDSAPNETQTRSQNRLDTSSSTSSHDGCIFFLNPKGDLNGDRGFCSGNVVWYGPTVWKRWWRSYVATSSSRIKGVHMVNARR